jgi:hypothetical protein
MAANTRTKSRTQVAMQRAATTARDRVVIMGKAAAPVVRRGASMAAKAALDEKHTLTALGSVAVVSYLDKNGQLDSLPDPMGIGPTATLGLALWAFGKYSKNPMAEHSATGLLCVALADKIKNG